MHTAEYFIRTLGLEPHIEGGYCRELYKNPQKVPVAPLSSEAAGSRPLSSTIYYLLKSGQFSKFHRLASDEIWFYHGGAPLLIHQIDGAGEMTTQRLGLATELDERPQVCVPGNTVFGAEVAEKDSFCLVSCMVSPGFDFQDFELFSAETLLEKYPQHRSVISRLNGY